MNDNDDDDVLLKFPGVYFGGKASVADLVWSRFGAVENYSEPFAGSAAVLLRRPRKYMLGQCVETINDLDCFISNVWRAMQQAPDEVAYHADYPVDEVSLHARHRYLVLGPESEDFRLKMRTDPLFYDARFAGWYLWGLSCWIGGGWCDVSKLERHKGQRPQLSGATGRGVHAAATPSLPDGKRPHIACQWSKSGTGVHATPSLPDSKRPIISQPVNGGGGSGVHAMHSLGTCAERSAWLQRWFARLADRLRNVRVCCGDWSRICSSPSTTTRLGVTAVMLDPPYSAEAKRKKKIYSTESLTVAHEVRAWCLKHGCHPMLRVALCGYEGEGHEELVEHGWTVHAWESQGGYGNQATGKRSKNNKRERIWFSPHCIKERTLFDGIDDDNTDDDDATAVCTSTDP